MFDDPIVEEVRTARQRHAKRFGYDLRKIADDIRERERRSERRIVSFPPKPAPDRTGTKGAREQTGSSDMGPERGGAGVA